MKLNNYDKTAKHVVWHELEVWPAYAALSGFAPGTSHGFSYYLLSRNAATSGLSIEREAQTRTQPSTVALCSGTLEEVRNEILRKRQAGRLPGTKGHLLKDWWSKHKSWPYPTVSPTVSISLRAC